MKQECLLPLLVFNSILEVLANALWQEKEMRNVNTGKEERKKTAIIGRGNSLIKVGGKIKSRIKTIWIDKCSGNWNRFYILKLILFYTSAGVYLKVKQKEA